MRNETVRTIGSPSLPEQGTEEFLALLVRKDRDSLIHGPERQDFQAKFLSSQNSCYSDSYVKFYSMPN
jgi:hypothetical protein